jgi:hypothetical protein
VYWWQEIRKSIILKIIILFVSTAEPVIAGKE